MPTVKELVPYIFVAMLTAGGSMWARLGESTKMCDERLAQAEKLWQARFDRQEARIDTASAKLERMQKLQIETYKGYFESLSKPKLKRR